MKLPKPFYRLPVRFDAARLAAELAEMPSSAWVDHPNEIVGNTSVRLISVDGAENDEVDGTMLPTQHLARAPYMRQVLASFGVVWSRSRLLKAGGARRCAAACRHQPSLVHASTPARSDRHPARGAVSLRR
jgi:hypothetical protein